RMQRSVLQRTPVRPPTLATPPRVAAAPSSPASVLRRMQQTAGNHLTRQWLAQRLHRGPCHCTEANSSGDAESQGKQTCPCHDRATAGRRAAAPTLHAAASDRVLPLQPAGKCGICMPENLVGLELHRRIEEGFIEIDPRINTWSRYRRKAQRVEGRH